MTNKTQAQYLDLVTPGMLRAAQLRSELGAYAASKLSGAYDLITELYGVMHAAADQVPPASAVLEDIRVWECMTCSGMTAAHCAENGDWIDVEEVATRFVLESDCSAYVTRLQAEVERLKQDSGDRYENMLKLANGVAELKSELTEARELWATEQAIKEQPGEDVLWQVLDAAVGVLTRRAAPHAWESEAFEAGRKIIMARREGLIATAPNQSAPADKGQGEPVHISGSFSDGPRTGIHAVKCVDDFSVSAQQRPAPTAKDHGEQSAFESWAQDDDRFGTSRTRSSGDYDEPDTQVAWDAWRARARMTEQPAPTTGYTAVDMSTAAAQGFRDGQAAAEKRITLQQVLKAYDYAESHPHKYLRGTTNWCAAVAHSLNSEPKP